jgi:uncharacterized protein YjgD (DUF1641 family)
MSDASTAELLTQVLERLDRLEQRLDAIQSTTDSIAPITAKAPVIVEAVASTAQFGFDQAVAAGIDPVKASVSGLELAAMAGQEESLATIRRLLEKQALLHRTLDMVDQLESDGSLTILLDKGGAMAPRVAKLMDTPVFTSLMDQALDEPKTLETANKAATALVETERSGWKPASLFAPLTALMDADIQKVVGFSLAVAKRLGQKL